MVDEPHPSGADRNLLYGVLALRLGFLTRDALIDGLDDWATDRSRPLSSVLLARGAIDPADHPAIEQVVARQLQRRRESATAAEPESAASVDFLLADPLSELLETLADPDLQASIARVRVLETRVDEATPTAWDATTAWGPSTGPDTVNTPVPDVNAPDPDPDPDSVPDAAPARPDRFALIRLHAVGGLGEVHVAWDEELGREVALKEIRARYADDPRARSRFVREAEVTGNLDHPGVVPVYSLGAHPDGRPYYAMRFVKGETLQEALERDHRDAPTLGSSERSARLRRLLRRFIDICDTIEYSHSRGVLHRDLKPANILIGGHGEALIIDWGLAKVLGKANDEADLALDPETTDPSSSLGASHATAVDPLVLHSSLGSAMPTIAGETLGSPPYMSPEQARGLNDELDRLTDVYSLGATLYAVVVGRPPIRGSKPREVLARVIQGDVVPPRVANPSVPAPLAAICATAMRLDPSRRYPSARALADDVQRWLDDQPVSVFPDPLATRILRWARRHKPFVAATLGVLLATILVLAGTTARFNAQRARAVEAKLAADSARGDAERSLRRARDAEATTRDIAYNFLEVVTLADRQVFTRMRPADREKFLAAGLRFVRVSRDEAQEAPLTRLRAAEVALRLATLYRVTGRFDEAARLYDDGVALLEGLVSAPNASPTHIDRLAEALLERGDASQTLGRVEVAARSFQRAADLSQRNLDAADRPEFRRTLGRSLSRLASAGLDLGRGDVPDVAGRAIEVLRPIATASMPRAQAGQTLSAADQLELAQALANRAEGLARAGRIDDAFAAFREAFARADRLARQFRGPKRSDLEFNHAWFGTRLARALTDLGAEGTLDEAAARLDDAVARLQKIQGGETPILAYRTALADALDARARLRLRKGDFEGAKTDARTAQIELEPLRKDEPAVVELMILQAEALDALAQATLGIDPSALADATALWDQAIASQNAARLANSANPVVQKRLAEYHSRRGPRPTPP